MSDLNVICITGNGTGTPGALKFDELLQGETISVVYRDSVGSGVSSYPAWATANTIQDGSDYSIVFTITSDQIGDPDEGQIDFTWVASLTYGDHVYEFAKTCISEDWTYLGSFGGTSWWGDHNPLQADCTPQTFHIDDPGIFNIGNYRRVRAVVTLTATVPVLYNGFCNSMPEFAPYEPVGKYIIDAPAYNAGPFIIGKRKVYDTGYIYGDFVYFAGLPGGGLPGQTFRISGTVYGHPDDLLDAIIPPDDGGGGGGDDGGGDGGDDVAPIGGIEATLVEISGNKISGCGGSGVMIQTVSVADVSDNIVASCARGIRVSAVIRSSIKDNQIENNSTHSVWVTQSSDNMFIGNTTGNPSIAVSGYASHYYIDDESSRNLVIANRTLRSDRLVSSGVYVGSSSEENAIAFNDFRGINCSVDYVDDNGVNTEIHWNLPFGNLVEQVQDIVGGMIIDTNTINATYDDIDGTLTLDVIPGSVDAGTLNGYGVTELSGPILVFNEDLSALCNGARTVFLLSNEFKQETTQIYLNGMLQRLNTAYTENTVDASIELSTAPEAGDELIVSYEAQLE